MLLRKCRGNLRWQILSLCDPMLIYKYVVKSARGLRLCLRGSADRVFTPEVNNHLVNVHLLCLLVCNWMWYLEYYVMFG